MLCIKHLEQQKFVCAQICQSAKGKVCCTTPGSSDLLCLRDICISLTSADDITVESSPVPAPALSSSQEEADTRIMLHCFHVATSCTSHLIVRSPDTDVFMLLLYYGNRIEPSVYFDTGFENKRRLMDMKCLIHKHGEPVFSNACTACIFWVRLYQRIHSRGGNHMI